MYNLFKDIKEYRSKMFWLNFSWNFFLSNISEQLLNFCCLMLALVSVWGNSFRMWRLFLTVLWCKTWYAGWCYVYWLQLVPVNWWHEVLFFLFIQHDLFFRSCYVKESASGYNFLFKLFALMFICIILLSFHIFVIWKMSIST